MNKREFLDSLRSQLDALPKNERDRWLSFYSEIIDDHVEDGQTEEEAITSLGSIVVTASSILDECDNASLNSVTGSDVTEAFTAGISGKPSVYTVTRQRNEATGALGFSTQCENVSTLPKFEVPIFDLSQDISRVMAQSDNGSYQSERASSKQHFSWGRKVVFWSTIPIWGSILIALLALLFSVWISAAAVVASLWVTTAALAICAPLSVGFILFMITTGSIPSVLFNIGTTLALFGLAILFFYASYEVTALFKRWTIWLWNLTKRLVRWVFSLSKKSISKKEIVTSNSEYPTEGVPVTA